MVTEKLTGKKVICSVSGGKDSTALWLYLTKDLGIDVMPIFADTGWEHPITYQYIEYLKSAIGDIVTVNPELNFVSLAQRKSRFPSAKCRFCTTELKLKPIRQYLKNNYASENIVMCSGVRGEESPSRAAMDEWCDTDEFFKCAQWRPILRWTWQQVFDIHKKYDIDPNPLYKNGMSRVGCMPCIMSNKSELAEIARRFPEVFDKVRAAEESMPGSHFSFWRPGDIPARFCSKKWEGSDGKEYHIPTAMDVKRYVEMDKIERKNSCFALFKEPQNEDFEMCSSIYGLCE